MRAPSKIVGSRQSTQAHSGDWLSAVPITACRLRLSDEAVRVAVGLRLGIGLGQAHQCICGEAVDTRGSHAFSCRRSPGRTRRHYFINDLVWRAMIRVGIPSVKEPNGLTRSDGKRPDGLISIPEGRMQRLLGCYRTVTNTVAASIIPGHVISSRPISRRSCSHLQRR